MCDKTSSHKAFSIKTTTYVYDSANQLIRENNQTAGKTWVWTYDDAGNILSKKEYAYTTGVLGSVEESYTYTYGNSNWGDLLTNYNGATITYDAIGNPLSDGYWTYTWQEGRKLASMSRGSTTWTYTYDANGMRTNRTTGSTTYNYTYHGSQLTHMTYGSNVLHFYYDASGKPLSVVYNGVTYYYVLNLQGDVVALLDSSGNQVVGYSYDAWGNPLTLTGSKASTLGLHNPLRYRGYVYDWETGLYYLQSRYYNPEIGRFINIDNQLVGVGGEVLGYNLFVYCNNNPINYYDSTGESAIAFAEAWMAFAFLEPTLFGEIVGVVILVVVGIAIGVDIYNDALTVDNTFVSVEFSSQSQIGVKDSTDVDDNGNPIVKPGQQPTEQDGYEAPKGGAVKGKTKGGKVGWKDKYGNIWVPVPTGSSQAHGGGHWDVQSPKGGYSNVHPGGKVRGGKAPYPHIPLLP